MVPLRASHRRNGMVGSSSSPTGESTDWINKASPDQLVQQATAIFGKVGQLPTQYQDQFAQGLRNNPDAMRLFERVGTATS
jgi:hypothetical protein